MGPYSDIGDTMGTLGALWGHWGPYRDTGDTVGMGDPIEKLGTLQGWGAL